LKDSFHMEEKRAILTAEAISKSFPGVKALTDVSLSCLSGEVLGLIGENGAGKSTLMNVLTGVIPPDSGTLRVDGTPCRFSDPEAARRVGIRIVYQELSLLPHLTVAENITLNHEPTGPLGFIDAGRAARTAEALLRKISDTLGVDAVVATLSPAEQQLVEIAKALDGSPRLLILDEPTSSLSRAETTALLNIIRELRGQGMAVIFISHRLEEILDLCDRVMVLKDGAHVKTLPRSAVDHDGLVSLMVGRELAQVFPPKQSAPRADVVIDLGHVSIAGQFEDVSLTVHAGEILGIGGLEGQGQRELIRALFGIEPIEKGTVSFLGREGVLRSPREAIRAGMAFISDDRKTEGVILSQSVASNMVLTALDKISPRYFIRSALERGIVNRHIDELSIRVSSFGQRARELSGGNQQKIVMAKWLETGPRLLLLDEPTRGIDVQTKMQIYQLLRELSGRGAAVMLVTSDMLELIGLSDRIAIIYEGRIVGELSAAEATEEKVMSLSSGLPVDLGRPR
jgi:ribose transport system ATP-binding protein